MSTPFPTRTACDCGAGVAFDADHEATTCGGLAVRGGYVCTTASCGRSYMAPGTVAADSSTWTLAKGGRSVDTGRIRLRAEGRGDVEHLMARVVRLPDLERALKRIAAGESPASKIAVEALGRPAAARRAWVARALAAATRPVRHRGNHKYVWALDRRARRALPAGRPYPKQIDEAA